MASLAWLLIPLFAAVGAGIWGSWAARDRTQGDISELAGYARFREAMAHADQTRPKTEAHSGSDAV
ncbi:MULTISPECIES: hypothetical protein [unclassified Streptomyces]|uniref:hypothetical protein n=1 Tax=unclassified Streptomyces TaxID=2593676 RepID=UPI002DDB5979|nr:hypothetical protein [Streptomyces sp. NBC_01294]WRZ57200.1 hypothetical protein OG534_12320 [Streptomyces sp. NBC_01294]